MTEQTPSDERPEPPDPTPPTPTPTPAPPPYQSLPYPSYPPLLDAPGEAPRSPRQPIPRAWLAGGLAALLVVAGSSGFAVGRVTADDGHHPPASVEWQRPGPQHAPNGSFDHDDLPAPPGGYGDD